MACGTAVPLVGGGRIAAPRTTTRLRRARIHVFGKHPNPTDASACLCSSPADRSSAHSTDGAEARHEEADQLLPKLSVLVVLAAIPAQCGAPGPYFNGSRRTPTAGRQQQRGTHPDPPAIRVLERWRICRRSCRRRPQMDDRVTGNCDRTPATNCTALQEMGRVRSTFPAGDTSPGRHLPRGRRLGRDLSTNRRLGLVDQQE